MDNTNLSFAYAVLVIFVSVMFPTLLVASMFLIKETISSAGDHLVKRKVRKYLRSFNNGTLSDDDRNAFLTQYGHEVATRTPSRLKCGNPKCSCELIQVSHHMYWYG